VIIDVAVLQVARDHSRTLGIYPGSPGLTIPATFTPGGAQATTTTGTGTTTTTTTSTTTSTAVPLARLARLSTGDWSMVLPGGTINLLLSDASTKLLQNPQVRASDGAIARLRIGERVPVATGSFQPGIGGVGINPLVNTQFQYLDVGVILEITPRVHGDGEVTMKMRVEISSVTSRVNIGGIDQPIIGQRTVEEEIRLKEGETNVLGGIMQTQRSSTLSGVPGLSQVPLLKYLFSSVNQVESDSEVLILMTPHIVRLPMISALNLRGIDVGTQTNIAVRTKAASAVPSAIPGGGVPVRMETPQAPPPATAAPPVKPGAAPAAVAPAKPPAGEAAPPETPRSETRPPARETAPARPSETAPGATAPAFRFDSAVYSQPVGSTFPVNIRIDNAENIHSVPFQLYYDAKQLKVVNILNGELLGQDGQAVAVIQRVDDQNGVATITLTRPPDIAGVSGSGVLATVSFQALAPGQSALNILRSAARNASQQPVSLAGAQTRVIIR